MSLRQLTRSVPRLASRNLASYSTRTAFRPFLSSIPRPNVTPFISRTQDPRLALFSTSSPRRDDAADELASKLDNEIALEKDESDAHTDSDSNVRAFLAQNDFWTLEDTPGEQHVSLTRQYDDESIIVSFSISDFSNPPMMPDEDADEALEDEDLEPAGAQSGGANTKGAINQGRTSGGNFKVAPEDSIAPADQEDLGSEEEDYDSQQAFPVNVNVLINRPGSKGSLRVSLIADSGRWVVQGLTHLPSSATPPTAADLHKEVPENIYTGPHFQQLDENVQDLAMEYLAARGINDALANFVPDFVDVKEQREYVGWLERVKEFVSSD